MPDEIDNSEVGPEVLPVVEPVVEPPEAPPPEPEPVEPVVEPPIEPEPPLPEVEVILPTTLEATDLSQYEPKEGEFAGVWGKQVGTLENMIEAGVPLSVQLEYIDKYPMSIRRQRSEEIIEKLNVQIRSMEGLTGEERVAQARTLGILPEGFDDYPQELKEAYGVSDEAYNTAVEAYNEKVIAQSQAAYDAWHALDIVKDEYGRLDLQKAFDMGLGAKVYEARALGLITPEAVVAAQFGAIKARGIARDIAKREAEIEAQEALIAGIKETAPGVVTTEDKVATVDGVTTTTTVTSVVLEEALLAGVTEATLTELGFNLADIRKAAEFVDKHTLLPDNQWMANTVVASIKEQSEYGYNILIKQGLVDYNTAIDSALAEMAEYERPSGYRLKPAVAAGVERTTLSLLFPKEAIDDAWRVKRDPSIPPEIVPTETEVSSGLPVSLIATLPIMGAVAVAEPTLIGEIVVGGVILTAAGIAIAQGKDIKWGALWDDITSAFKKETGREPTETEVEEIETTATSMIRVGALPVVGMPKAIALKVAEPIPLQPPDFPRVEVKLGVPPFPMPQRIPLQPPDFPRVEVKLGVPPFPIAEPMPVSPPGFPARIEPVLPQIIAAQVAVADAEEKLAAVVIKPKIMTPTELDTLWGLTKTEAGLIALDAAVQDAFTAGEIDADTLKVYSQAKDEYLAKKGILDSATTAATTDMGLPVAKTEEEMKLARDVVIAHNAVIKARRVWAEYQARSIAEPTPMTAEQVALQQARTQEGMRLSAEAAENQRLWESTLKVYYDAVGESNIAYQAKLEALNQAINKSVGEYQPQLVTDVSSLISAATQLALSDLQKQATQAATQAYQQALTQGLTQAQAQTAAQTAAQQAIQTASQTATQQAVQTATRAATKTATKALAKTLTNTVTQTAVNTAVNIAVATATTTMTQTATTTATTTTGIVLPPPKPDEEDIRKLIRPGTLTWRQGLYWIILPPPYTKRHYSKTPPPGVTKLATGEGSAYKTIQVLNGRPKEDVLGIDIGIAIVDIRVKGKELTIHFKQDPTDTYVGKKQTTDEWLFGGKDKGRSMDEFLFSKSSKPKKKNGKKPKKITHNNLGVGVSLKGVR